MYVPSIYDIQKDIEESLDQALSRQEEALIDIVNQFSNISQPYNIVSEYEYPISVYNNGEIVYWNSNKFIPSYSQFRSSDSIYFYNEASSLIISRKTINYYETGLIEFYAFLPVYTYFDLSNEYLQSELNRDIFGRYDVSILDPGIPITWNGKYLFGFDLNYIEPGILDYLFEILLVIALFITLIISYSIIEKKYPLKVVYSFLFSLLVARLLTLYFGFSLGQYSFLFDKTIYTSDWLSPSIGDLTMNLFLLFLFSRLSFNTLIKNIKFNKVVLRHRFLKYLWLVFITGLALASFTLLFDLTWNVLENSQITLDISESVSFSFTRLYFYVLLLFAGVIFFHFNHVAFQYFIRIANSFQTKALFIITIAPIYLLISNKFGWIILIFFTVLWLILYVSELSFQLSNVRYLTFYYYIIVSISVSIVSSVAIYKHYERDEVVKKKKFASGLLLENDILAEYYLKEVINDIENEPNIRSRLYTQLLARQNLIDKVLQSMPSYLNKYDIQVHVFDPNGFEFIENNSISIVYWYENYAKDEFKTTYENIFFVPSKGDGRDKYFAFISLEQFGMVRGSIILELTVKKYIPSTVFPSLLVEESPQKTTEEYDYAIYKEGDLVLSQGDFSFENKVPLSFIDRIISSKRGIEIDQNHYYGQNISNDRQLIITSETYDFFRMVSNVSFFFILSLMVIGLIYLVIRYTNQLNTSSLSNRIQIYIGLSFLFPTLFISIAILNTLNISYREEVDENSQKTARNLAENLVNSINYFVDNRINRDQFVGELSKSSNLVQTDLIIYDEEGKLMGTSRPEVFRDQLLSEKINPEALRFIKNQMGTAEILEENIGKLTFKTVYTGIFDFQDGELLAILALPYFDAKNSLNTQQVTVFSNLIIFFSLVFIITVVLGNIGIQNLIVPIKSIAERLSKTNLMEVESKPLEYNSADEIGVLVREYNTMLEKLDDSKKRLAQIQKETAWKEIARQVAHEIKNPLTPMRLRVQQIQRDKDQESNEYRMLSSMLTQIDSLSSIADSFSAFAKLPAPQNEEFDLSEVVSDVARLYQGDDFQLNVNVEKNLIVYADPKLMSQILNNLILNAIQSFEGTDNVIEINLESKNQKAICTVKDNGRGISETVKNKIFTPYFSTKDKGSGIGLALAKKGIEQANGTIWFDTEENIGTSFYFLLPLV